MFVHLSRHDWNNSVYYNGQQQLRRWSLATVYLGIPATSSSLLSSVSIMPIATGISPQFLISFLHLGFVSPVFRVHACCPRSRSCRSRPRSLRDSFKFVSLDYFFPSVLLFLKLSVFCLNPALATFVLASHWLLLHCHTISANHRI